jgi:zinc/manganese transport system substrate-binding protein
VTAVLLAAASGCTESRRPAAGDCPVAPAKVVVTVDQWGDIARSLGGDCADVTTIITGSSADPHDYEPTPSDAAAFDGARLVVVDGLGYDAWAGRALEAAGGHPTVVDAGKVAGLTTGDDPHVWYDPTVVRHVADRIAVALRRLLPRAGTYLAAREAAWNASLVPYDAAIERVRGLAVGRTYAATEPVFDHMARAVGLRRVTPASYQRAAADETEPSPAALAGFEDALTSGAVDVLVVNRQTEGPAPARLRDVARRAGVPVVEVTETVPAGTSGFVDWQVRQLDRLADALGAR